MHNIPASQAFYNRENPGDRFFRPALFVRESYGWIFSEIRDEECDLFITLISRVVLFSILPFVAATSLLFIPLGLLINSLAPDFRLPLPIGTLQENGELVVKDNGDCLFESFLRVLHRGSTPPTIEEIQQERLETVTWMLENFGKNEKLRQHLKQTIYNLFLSLKEQLKSEKADLIAIDKEFGGGEAAKTQIANLTLLLNFLKEDYLNLLEATFEEEPVSDDEVSETSSNSQLISILAGRYLEDMTRKGKFGSDAELYALSCRYQVPVKVFAKDQSGINPKCHPFFNLELETQKNSAICLTLNQVTLHYNAYFPDLVTV